MTLIKQWASMAEVREANAAAGLHWFSKSTLAFFGSRLHGGMIKGRYFVSSETDLHGVDRRYTVREVDSIGGVTTRGGFRAYATLAEARKAVRLIG